jgi:hypothetical protein
MMKKIIYTSLLLLGVVNVSLATDRFVDPLLSAGNGSTLFNSINTAITACVNGDRVIVPAGTYNEPSITIDKSITLMPQVPGTIVNLNADITIGGFGGMKLQLIGINMTARNIYTNAVTAGTATSRAKVSLIDCKADNIFFDNNWYELNVIRCTNLSSVRFRYGNVILSNTSSLYVNDEPSQNLSNSRILIIQDSVDHIEYRNDDHICVLANCLLRELFFWKWNTLSTITNYIRNNDFQNNAILFMGYGAPAYNQEFSSNLFLGTVSFINNVGPCNVGAYDGNYAACNWSSLAYSSSYSLFPNPTAPGFFKWTYNGLDLPCTLPYSGQPLVLTKIIGTTGTNTNTGNPAHEYYDIDLTVNDRGRNGGPYGTLNYFPSSNPNNSKAFIFDLDMPTDLFSGQQVNIKAKGYHKN